MQALRAAIVLIAAGMAVVQYLQEKRRLDKIGRLSGPAARDLYERARRSADRTLVVVTAGSAVLGLVSLSYLLGMWGR